MGSQTKRLRKAKARELRTAVVPLVNRATKRRTHTSECWQLDDEQLVEMVIGGWRIQCGMRVHASTEREPLEHWHLVMQIHPKGRPERDRDWDDLADFVSRVAAHTGYEGAYIDALAPLDRAPHAPHHFVWHSNEAPVSGEDRRAMARRIALMESAA